MGFLKAVLKEVKSIFTFYVFILVILTAFHSIFVEPANLQTRGLKREGKFSRVIGIVYIVLGLALYLVSRYL